MGREEGGSLRAEYAYDLCQPRIKAGWGQVRIKPVLWSGGADPDPDHQKSTERQEGSPLSMPRREEKRSIPAMPVTFTVKGAWRVVSYCLYLPGQGSLRTDQLTIEIISSTIRKAGRWCRWMERQFYKPSLTFMASRYHKACTDRKSAR